ncbi:MAG: hypothetical protein M2R45_01046 [Verrucomicrobia subdivision 3 bacterium]|nr:hypothetical protein [Limisphaerales bacterium]MCS1414159.1 hypothetical protein [Limisphaerales bacterium]
MGRSVNHIIRCENNLAISVNGTSRIAVIVADGSEFEYLS